MPGLTLWRHRRYVPGRGISSIAEVPRDPSSTVLHLCRYPDKWLHDLRSAPRTVLASGRSPILVAAGPGTGIPLVRRRIRRRG